METRTPDGIHYRVVGTNDPTILFVHGYGCSHTDWDRQLEGLSSQFRCAALDTPGHGQSPQARAPIIPALAAAVNSVKQHIGAREVVLVGHSLGTKIVREAYRQSRDGVIGLVFVEGSDPKLVEGIVSRSQAVDPQYAEDLYVEAGAWDSVHGLEQLRQVQVPTLVLQSSYYNLELHRLPLKQGITTPLMEAVAREIGNSEVKVIEGVGHFTMLEAPEAVNREIAAFVRRIGKQKPGNAST